ncbi:MAG TPA: hypothetical protein VF732_10370, partial [Nitrospira sp.]
TTLRQQRRVCQRIRLAIRYSDHHERAVQQTLHHGIFWEADLQPVLTSLFTRCFRRRIRLQRITLRVDRLGSPAQQLSLFEESEPFSQPTHYRLSLALDRIRMKFGERAVSWGKTLR